jgi:nitronate monooxygenase
VSGIRTRTGNFCRRFQLEVPILLAPMSGLPAPELSSAVANAGGLGACGVLLMSPEEIVAWAAEVRSRSRGAFQLNNWIRDPPPLRDSGHEAAVREFLAAWGPPVPAEAGDARPPDFDLQCEAMLAAGAPIVSSVMGLFPSAFIRKLKQRDIAWLANVSTVAEARAAEAAGADVIAVQGLEAGGHRASFDALEAERWQVGLMALLPAVVDAVSVPVVAAGGIADARGVAAALVLGASAVQVGTAFLRCPEARVPAAWAEALARTAPEGTALSRVFSGRAGRSLATAYVRSASGPAAPRPAPYPVQRGLTAAMRTAAVAANDVERMQAWAGQAAAMARAEPAARVVERLWRGACDLLDAAALTVPGG